MIKIILRRVLPPVLIVVIFIGLAGGLMSTKQAPEQKAEEVPVPIVNVVDIKQETVSLNLPSYGVVTPKYKTILVAEVQGRLLSISDKFVAGGMVKKGDTLAQIEPSDYQADLSQAQATLAQAKAKLDEEVALGKVAKKDWEDYQNGPAPDLGLRIPQRKQEEANVKFAEAALARAQRNLERTVIRAPFDGIIKARSVDLGQYVTIGTNLGELYDTQTAEIRLPIANNELAYLESIDHPDTDVTLSTELAERTVTWKGQIVRSEGVIDQGNRMVYLVAEISDPYLRANKKTGQLPLKYGSFVTAVIKGRTVDGIVTLPRHVVRKGTVAVVRDDNTIEMRQVNIVRSDVENVYIKGGLKEGERISITNINNMATGQLVKVIGEENSSDIDRKDDVTGSAIAAAGEK
ncbi:efflux RND transporter periplasmic adaptor subunit [Shewanella sp. AS1]|uniref:efflux RND transporter periplasmic adaptor subunit n=1 Tax=Shewanella sp. AS1 TaxID=2907626 RepID=UPI001F3A35AC|nr:efflux RND transporter periplasmic adaptor subunit [Shewanella sp. AS1]MCE9677784.1 efflux RND transporter periplasmic adaptor subunit [Shewanella sp. AS1]